MSYLKPYVEGRLAAYRAPEEFVPGGNAIGTVLAVGSDVWHLKQGSVSSSHLVAGENVQEPGQLLIGVTSPGVIGDELQRSWKDGFLAEYALLRPRTSRPSKVSTTMAVAELTAITRCIVPYGGLLRGRLKAGETAIMNGRLARTALLRF